MISLIVSTKGRVAEIGELFESLLADASAAYEVILVDQNEDDRLAPLAFGDVRARQFPRRIGVRREHIGRTVLRQHRGAAHHPQPPRHRRLH